MSAQKMPDNLEMSVNNIQNLEKLLRNSRKEYNNIKLPIGNFGIRYSNLLATYVGFTKNKVTHTSHNLEELLIGLFNLYLEIQQNIDTSKLKANNIDKAEELKKKINKLTVIIDEDRKKIIANNSTFPNVSSASLTHSPSPTFPPDLNIDGGKKRKTRKNNKKKRKTRKKRRRR